MAERRPRHDDATLVASGVRVGRLPMRCDVGSAVEATRITFEERRSANKRMVHACIVLFFSISCLVSF